VEKPVITGSERLQLAIAFSRMNLDRLRPGDWLNLQYDLKTFLGCNPERQYRFPSAGGIIATPLAHPLPDEFSEDDFRSLQTHARSMLQDATQEILPIGPGIEMRGGYMSWLRASEGKWGHIIAQGPTHDMFLLTLMFLLNQEPSGRLKRCPECKAVFYRIKKQRYCSPTCTNKTTMSRWRAKQKQKGAEAQEASRQKRHERYEAAQHKKHPTAKLKVARRTRQQHPA
jgi:hypothetical protein